ncbi:YgcG family protein [Bradyrhizobium sp.]|uniref:TPM domain-containing protein n=1 Tax=Bradyrhizobium sp. TaxID=376 RepID=UPI00261E4794|nr:YgcG family protein [Bradyrhizobium sp.]
MIVRALLFVLVLCWPFVATADVAVPALSGRVVDQTGTLSSGDIDTLTQKLKDLEKRKGSQVAVLIVPTTQPETIEQFSVRVAEAWKIGRRKIDDGALLVVAKNDHKLRIEVGYGLEGALTDITARRVIDEIIVPRFRTGDFSGGISAGVDRIIRVIDGEPLPKPQPEVSHNNAPDFLFNVIFSPFGFLGYVAVAAIMRGLLGRLLGSGVTAGLVGAVVWFILGSIALSAILGVIAFFLTMFGDGALQLSQQASRSGRGSYGGGWSTGSSGGSWSSGSSDGGFSGGGGGFGGGGASGSW